MLCIEANSCKTAVITAITGINTSYQLIQFQNLEVVQLQKIQYSLQRRGISQNSDQKVQNRYSLTKFQNSFTLKDSVNIEGK